MLKIPYHYQPWLIFLLIMAIALIILPNTAIFFTLSVAGIATGSMIFIATSGLSMIYGMAKVANFGHGIFLALGAFVAYSIFHGLHNAAEFLSPWLILLFGLIGAMVFSALISIIFERILVKPTKNNQFMQILTTSGGLIIGVELIKIFWGAHILTMPNLLSGLVLIGDFSISYLRIFTIILGLAILISCEIILYQTKLGIMLRALVENPQMLDIFGYYPRQYFLIIFIVGSALGGLGGALIAMQGEVFSTKIAIDIPSLLFIIIIMGGLGNIRGSYYSAIFLGVFTNYVGYIAPKLPNFCLLIVLFFVLLWRPNGLFKDRHS